MTLTMIGLAPPPVPTPTPREAPRATGGQALLTVLRDIVGSSTDLDPDLLHSTLPAGRAVLTLAAAARACTAGLGGQGGTVVSEAPGIVVMRELVRALDLLETAVHAGDVPPDLGALPEELADAHRTFRRTVGHRP